MLKDKDIREPLFDFLEEEFGKIRIIEEKTIHKSRSDAIMITEDYLYGIEIKSDADTYTRLASQISDYNKYFDFNYVVVGSSHRIHIVEHIPFFWGVIVVSETNNIPSFEIVREAIISPKMKWKNKLELLWRTELATIQNINKMPKYKDKSKKFIMKKIIERIGIKISESQLRIQISDILFNRDYNLIEEEINYFKKSELDKKIMIESDPEKRLDLALLKDKRQQTFRKNISKKAKTKGKH